MRLTQDTPKAGLQVKLFPCRSDNYGFLIHDPMSGQTAAVDTPDASEIMRQADAAGWILTHIFNTHHHHDHVGGNLEIKASRAVQVIGPRAEARKIPGLNIAVGEAEQVQLGELTATVWDTPAHTAGHIAYHFEADAKIFVGDTLFALGCGRLFEGTAAQMWTAMQRFAALPDATQVYCAHEYTLANGKFALTVDAENEALARYMEKARSLRAQNIPTVPTTIGAEKAANPFMRAGTAKRLGEIRALKDNF